MKKKLQFYLRSMVPPVLIKGLDILAEYTK